MRLPIDLVAKAIKGKILPMALYGVQTAHLSAKAAKRLQTVCADALLNRKDDLRAPELVLAFAGYGVTTVQGAVALERLKTLRRVNEKRPEVRELVCAILAKYRSEAQPRACGP
eukprot:3670892-Alexandrium_andersonii.AAC.1